MKVSIIIQNQENLREGSSLEEIYDALQQNSKQSRYAAEPRKQGSNRRQAKKKKKKRRQAMVEMSAERLSMV